MLRFQAAQPPMKIESSPKLAAQYWQAFTQTKPGLTENQPIPRAMLEVERVAVDSEALVRFREFVGSGEAFPLSFAYVLAQPAHLHMINQPGFPVRSMGLVHAQNRIERLQSIDSTAPFSLQIAVVDDHARRRGREFTVETLFVQNGARCLIMRSGYLSRVRGAERSKEKLPAETPAPAPQAPGTLIEAVPFASNFGRRYARVSGDYNPIHLASWLARPFGFRRAIAHGIGALARIDAVLGQHQRGSTRVLAVVFRRPVDLPSNPQLHATANANTVVLLDAQGRELQVVEREWQ